MIRAVVYSRVSSDRQAAEGVSLDSQLAMAKKHCEERGWVLTDTYTDVMSGRKDKRPELSRLEQDAKAKRFDVVIVYKVDRLARSARKYYELLTVFRDKDVSLFSLTQPIDTTTPTGKFLLGQMILIAELEVDNTSERVTANMRHLAASGKWVTGPRTALGYRYIQKHVNEAGETIQGRPVVDEDEAERVRHIFATFVRVKSLRTVCNMLNESGMLTREGAIWRTEALHNLLRNPIYIGRLAYGKATEPKNTSRRRRIRRDPSEWVVVEDAVPSIVDRGLWEQAQAILDDNRGKHPRTKYGQKRFAWSGLFRCEGEREGVGTCGGTLVVHRRRIDGHEYADYLCKAYLDGGKAACPNYGRVGHKFLELVVVPELDRVFREAALSQLAAKERKVTPLKRPDSRAKKIAAIEAKKEREKALFRGGYVTFEEFEASMAKIDTQLRAIGADDGAAQHPALPPVPDDFAGLWSTLPPEMQGVLLRTFIAWIEVRRGSIEIQFRPFDAPGWPETLLIPIVNMRWHKANKA